MPRSQLSFAVALSLLVPATAVAAPRTGDVFCEGTVSACPCGNAGAPGNGCASGINPNGASLIATGVPSISNDTVTLIASGMPQRTAVIIWQSINPSSAVFGDGLLCVGDGMIGVQRRATNGEIRLGFGVPGITVAHAGYVDVPGPRYCQVWYRSSTPTFCTSATFNATNGLILNWTP